ncbi:hypothetical protein [Nocardioides sp. Arc9.136]|uniref:hypothetical protein n=1 Tax=Nocardioides sp. Arc9.136 TaxID=2996826 RepID=UPI002666E9D9|nr:hypothetical protein [Nocardioides sp. Arc9.136]WKN50342.1 hypothetical protein OSR43_09485 [Nocardioides sp. Arc9.136]
MRDRAARDEQALQVGALVLLPGFVVALGMVVLGLVHRYVGEVPEGVAKVYLFGVLALALFVAAVDHARSRRREARARDDASARH